MTSAKAQDAELGKPKEEVKQQRRGPDSILYRGLVWLLLNGQVFPSNRDLITEGAYLRMRGGKKWPWVADTSFASMHEQTEEDIRALYNEPLGTLGVSVAWLMVLTGIFFTAWGIARGNDAQIALASLAVAPVVLAMVQISRARCRAKCTMVRGAYENERCTRQQPHVTALEEEDRTAIVAHHIVLSFLEEVLETCVYGESPSAADRMHAAAAAANLNRSPNTNNNHNNAREAPSDSEAMEAGTARPVAAVAAAVDGARAQALMRAARGLTGNFKRGSMDTFGEENGWCYKVPATASCGLSVFSVSRRLRNIPKFCDQAVDVVLYKYGWSSDSDLRQAAVVKAETKLRKSAAPGHHWYFSVLVTALCNAVFIGAAVAVAVATGTWHAYVPLIAAALFLGAASVVLLLGKLPTWRVVDGMTHSARARVEAGTVLDEVTAATDVATRALDMSLRTFDDRGELQSCSYWRQMVPADMHSGLVVGVSGGLYNKLGSETRSLYGNVSGRMSGPLSGISGTQVSPQNSWRTLPEPDYAALHSTKVSLQSMDGKYPHSKPETSEHTAARPEGPTSTSAGFSTSSSNTLVGQEPTMMGQEPTCMSLAAAEDRSMHEGDASMVSPRTFGPSQASKSSGGSDKRGRAARASGSGSSWSPACMAGTDSSFAFQPESERGLLHKGTGAPPSTSRSATAVSSSTDRTGMSTPLQPGRVGRQESVEALQPHSPDYNNDAEGSSPHHGLTPAHPSFTHMLTGNTPSPPLNESPQSNKGPSEHLRGEIVDEDGSQCRSDDSTVLGPRPKDVRVDVSLYSSTLRGSSCVQSVSHCGTAKSHPLLNNDGSTFSDPSSFMEGSGDGRRTSTLLPPLPGLALFDAQHLVAASAGAEQAQSTNQSMLPALQDNEIGKKVSKDAGLKQLPSRHVVGKPSSDHPTSPPSEIVEVNNTSERHTFLTHQGPPSSTDSQDNGSHHSSPRGASFLEILNAHPDVPVGQDVVNDALAVVKNLPPTAPRSQADTLRSGSGPASYSPGLLEQYPLSRVYSTCGSNDNTPQKVNASELPANTERMNERHVFHTERKMMLDRMFSRS